jgi:hypothetical protein
LQRGTTDRREVIRHHGFGGMVTGSSGELRQVFSNLNAMDALAERISRGPHKQEVMRRFSFLGTAFDCLRNSLK